VQDIALGLPLEISYNMDTQWVRIPANEWRSVVAPGNEVGVFSDGSKMENFPYTPKEVCVTQLASLLIDVCIPFIGCSITSNPTNYEVILYHVPMQRFRKIQP